MKEKVKGALPYIIILVVVIVIRFFIVTPVRVNGPSMNETLSDGDILILNKLDKKYDRFDIVVLSSNVVGEAAIKRVIGLPGETVEIQNGAVYINTKKLEDPYNNINLEDLEKTKLNNNEYFVMGDNREVSLDSRYFGAVNEKDIEGTAHLRLFPFNEIGMID